MTGTVVLVLLISATLALAIAGLLAAGETAISLMSRARTDSLVEISTRDASQPGATRKTRAKARAAAWLQLNVQDVPRTVASCVFTRITLEMYAAVTFTLIYSAYHSELWKVGLLGVLTSALASFLLTGVSPRTRGRRNPEETALRSATAMRVVAVVFGWISQLLVHVGSSFTPGGAVGGGPFASEVQLRQIVEIASENDHLEDEEAEMIQSVVEFSTTPVRQVMVDRTRIVAIRDNVSLEQALKLFNRSGHSRLPVIGDDVDDLRGLLYLKDALRALYGANPATPTTSILEFIREPNFVPDSSAIDSVLHKMRTTAVHVVIVIDEYGGIAGLATIEDLIEEIIGEISDEHDREQQELAQEVSPHVWEVPAHMNVSDAGELLDLEIDDDDVDSVGGLLGKAIGLVPVPGSSADVLGMHILALETAGRRKTLHRLRIRRTDIARGDAYETGTSGNQGSGVKVKPSARYQPSESQAGVDVGLESGTNQGQRRRN